VSGWAPQLVWTLRRKVKYIYIYIVLVELDSQFFFSVVPEAQPHHRIRHSGFSHNVEISFNSALTNVIKTNINNLLDLDF
jgi:hypothetical protein